MSEEKLPELGKIHPAFFDRVIYPRLGAASGDVVIGPNHGVDYGVIRVGGRYMAFSTDPFFIVPSFGFSKAAWFGFHIVFCDVAVSGLEPRYLTIDLNLPPEIAESELEEMWEAVHAEALNTGSMSSPGTRRATRAATTSWSAGRRRSPSGANAIFAGPTGSKRGTGS